MSTMRRVVARVRGFLRRERSDDLHEELQAHLDMEIAEYVRRGMTPAEARRRTWKR